MLKNNDVFQPVNKIEFFNKINNFQILLFMLVENC